MYYRFHYLNNSFSVHQRIIPEKPEIGDGSKDVQRTKSLREKIPMEKLDALRQVAEFHRTFKHPILDQPQIPSAERCRLRVALIAEELKELEEAIADQDIVEVADALCDIQYVLAGAVLEFGLGEQFKALFDEVQRSNMSKTCKTKAEAEATMQHYKETQGVDSYMEQAGDVFLVYRQSDKKTLKSVNYSPADLKSLLQK